MGDEGSGAGVNCRNADCRVSYWRDVVGRGYRDKRGHQVACDDKDARLALSSAELVCRVFHTRALSADTGSSISPDGAE